MGILVMIFYAVLAASLGSSFFENDFPMIMLSVAVAILTLSAGFYLVAYQPGSKNKGPAAKDALNSAGLLIWLLLTLAAENTKATISGYDQFELVIPATILSTMACHLFFSDILNFYFKLNVNNWENWLRIFLLCYLVVQYFARSASPDSAIIFFFGLAAAIVLTVIWNHLRYLFQSGKAQP